MKIQAIYKQLVILLSIAWFAISCEKLSTKKAVTANVQVIDLTTGTGMPKRTVILKELKSTLPGVDVTVIDEATTDANGNCTFEFEAKKALKYKYEVEFIYDDSEYLLESFRDNDSVLFDGNSRIEIDKEVEQKSYSINMILYGVLNVVFFDDSSIDNSNNLMISFTNNTSNYEITTLNNRQQMLLPGAYYMEINYSLDSNLNKLDTIVINSNEDISYTIKF